MEAQRPPLPFQGMPVLVTLSETDRRKFKNLNGLKQVAGIVTQEYGSTKANICLFGPMEIVFVFSVDHHDTLTEEQRKNQSHWIQNARALVNRTGEN